MLHQTLIQPRLLAELPADQLPQRLFCNLWIGILSGLAENGILVIPHAHVTEADYLSAVTSWPPKYRKRALELITALKLRKRLVHSQHPYTPSSTCPEAECQPFVGSIAANAEGYYFTRESCLSCPSIQPLAARIVNPLDFFICDFARMRCSNVSTILTDGQWSTADFEQKILRPIFATAKHVKIYDRYIGRSVVGPRSIALRPAYRKCLEWIVSVYHACGGATRGGVFEIYCGVETNAVSTGQRPQIRAALSSLETSLQGILGSSVRIFAKEERKAAQCPHGRYLITDQIAVLIERGFDLLWDDSSMNAAGLNPAIHPRKIRDTGVVLCSDAGAMETRTKMLPTY